MLPPLHAGKQTRKAAKELLRSYGRAGTSAFRAVNRSTLEAMSNTNVYAAGGANAGGWRKGAQAISAMQWPCVLQNRGRRRHGGLSLCIGGREPSTEAQQESDWGCSEGRVASQEGV